MKYKLWRTNLFLSMAALLTLLGLLLTGTVRAADTSFITDMNLEDSAVEENNLAPSASVATISNGDFETGDFTGWGGYHTGNNGNWFVYSGTTSPYSGHLIAAPPQGNYAATSDQLGSSLQILYQDIALPVGGHYELKFTLYYQNWAGIFYTPDSLSPYSYPNQQYRVDIVDPTAPVDSVSPGDVLANLFRTETGDPSSLTPTEMTFDLSAFAGQTVRLRFAGVQTQYYFNASVDDIQLNKVGGGCDLTPVLDATDLLESKLDSLPGQLDGITNLIRGLATAVEAIEAKLDAADTERAALEVKLDELGRELAAERTKAGDERAALESKSDAMEAKLDAVESKLDTGEVITQSDLANGKGGVYFMGAKKQ